MNAPVIVWFRQDLRLSDNPALNDAILAGHPVIPIYILDENSAEPWKMGAASRWWLHHSLIALNNSLSDHLVCYKGSALEILIALAHETKATAVFWNRCYEPWRVERDKNIKDTLQNEGINVKSFNGSLLFEPWSIKKSDGSPYRVFTPFFRKGCTAHGDPAYPLPAPAKIPFADKNKRHTQNTVHALELLPSTVRWDTKMEPYWEIGEKAALARFNDFIDDGLQGYKEGRNYPTKNNVSRLSPHIHFGEISPRTLWHGIRQRMVADNLEIDGDHFLSELGWREFSYSLLYYNPDLPSQPLQKRFDHFPWRKDNTGLLAWQRGETGYPIVDAGMRELWETGYMHNRVRMIVGSFLVKDLLIHWSAGEKWFWDCLIDADLANNAASWQWIAGCGADAAPYFRIFNPVSQGERFDPDGHYIRRFIPELKSLPDAYIHHPWEAPESVLKTANILLGKTYPHPIVDHKVARLRALAAFQSTKG